MVYLKCCYKSPKLLVSIYVQETKKNKKNKLNNFCQQKQYNFWPINIDLLGKKSWWTLFQTRAQNLQQEMDPQLSCGVTEKFPEENQL